MKLFLLLFFLVFSNCYHLLAQTDSLQPLQKHIIYISKLIDSLPYFIQNGKATLKPSCALPDHDGYLIAPNGTIFFSKQVLGLSESKKQDYILMYACNWIANALIEKQDYVNAKKWASKALDIADRDGFGYEELHLHRIMINNICFYTGDYEGAMNISTAGLAKAERINDVDMMIHYNNVLGYIMMQQKSFDASEKYYLTELDLAKRIADPWEEGHALENLSDLYIAENKLDKAISFIHRAMNVYEAKASDTSNGMMERVNTGKAISFNKLAEVYKMMERYNDALEYSLLAVKISKKPKGDFGGDLYNVSSYHINAGNIYNRLDKPDSALFYSRIGLKLADSIKHREDLRDAYEQLSLAYAIKKNFDSAYFYQQLFTKLKDSIQNENSQQNILMREADLRVERNKRAQDARISRQQSWRNIIIGIAVLTILMVIMFYNRRRTKQRMLYQEQLNKQQNEMFNLAASAQEKERKRIAEDLHDGLGSVLSAAKLKLSALNGGKNFLTGEQKEKYQATLSLLDEASAELRNVSHNIMPATLSKLGLIAALSNVTERISSHAGLIVELETHGMDSGEDKRLEESIEISIYRIILELLNNIVKHAEATRVIVQLIKYPAYINITVEDNGKGFEYKKAVNEKKGIGLGNIESRVSYLNGTIEVDSRVGKGTVTIIDIPYNSDIKIP